MTEDEAKSKWCAHTGVVAAFEPRNNMLGAQCIASACMAWRKSTVYIDRATGEPAIPGVTAAGALELRYSGQGFCGLAGAPQ